VQHNSFDWDRYFAHASFEQIRALSPDLSCRRPPSVYNPDRSLLYLASLDVDVPTADPEQLRIALDQVVSSYFDKVTAGSDSGKAIARTDFLELCNLLAGCAEDPEPYLDPDALLERAGKVRTVS
jgi:hypothetical protein